MASSALPWIIGGAGVLAIGLFAAASSSAADEPVRTYAGGLYRYTAKVVGMREAEFAEIRKIIVAAGITDLKVTQVGSDVVFSYVLRAPQDEKYFLGKPHLTYNVAGRETSVIFTNIEQLEAPPSK